MADQRVTGVTLLIGGARSGKSSLAVEIGRRHDGPVHVIATAEPFDDDLRARIDRHRAERPDWPTIEEPIELDSALAAPPDEALVVLDCLTVWVANLLHHGRTDDEVVDLARRALDAATHRSGPMVVITNEVGLGLHPETDLGRQYRDLLGRVNQIWAAGSTRTLWLVAGRALPLVDPWELLS